MSTILTVLLIYFVFQILRKAAQDRPPRQQVPNYNPLRDDDMPLPGPWNRRAESVESSPLPGPWDERPDEPLPGPWSRRPGQESPVEMEPDHEPYDEPDYQSQKEPAGVKSPLPEAPPREVAVEPLPPRRERRREYIDGFTKKDKTPDTQSCETEPICAPDDRAAITPQPLRRRSVRRRREHPLEAVLNCKTTLVGGLILGEVLGNRGGRAAGRGRRF